MKRLTLFFFLLLFALSLQGQKVITYGEKALRVYDANLVLKTPYTVPLWLDGNDASSFTLDGTSVDNWADKSGNGNDVANANDNDTRPTYDVSTGKVTFIAANSTFLQSADFGGDLEQPNTVFIVYEITGGLGDTEIIFDGLTGTDKHTFYILSSTFKIAAGATITGSATDADNNIHYGLFNGVSSEYWINGVNVVSGNASTNGLDGITLGSNYTFANFADCEISEVIVFDGAISDTWRDKITAYLANKWSITATTDFKGYILRQD